MSRKEQQKQLRRCKQEVSQLKSRLKSKYRESLKQCSDYLKKYYESGDSPADIEQTQLRIRRELDGHFGKVYAVAASKLNEIASGSLDEKVIVKYLKKKKKKESEKKKIF